jgi:hypothetical protein
MAQNTFAQKKLNQGFCLSEMLGDRAVLMAFERLISSYMGGKSEQ